MVADLSDTSEIYKCNLILQDLSKILLAYPKISKSCLQYVSLGCGNRKETESSLQFINTIGNVVVDQIVVMEHEDKHYLVRILAIHQSQQQVEVRNSMPALSYSSVSTSYTKLPRKLTIEWSHVTASFTNQPPLDRYQQLLLLIEQFHDIQRFCRSYTTSILD